MKIVWKLRTSAFHEPLARHIILERCMIATGYQLLVYGNKRQDEVYCAKCERLIKKLGMQDHVFIMGLAKPAEILRQGWIYLQVRLFLPLTPPCPKLALPQTPSPPPKTPPPPGF